MTEKAETKISHISHEAEGEAEGFTLRLTNLVMKLQTLFSTSLANVFSISHL